MRKAIARSALVLAAVLASGWGISMTTPSMAKDATQGDPPIPAPEMAGVKSGDPQVLRGEYLARVGDCFACHTAAGGKPFAGGLGIASPIGTIYSTNITPDKETGIGNYTLEDFDNAVRHGVCWRLDFHGFAINAHFTRAQTVHTADQAHKLGATSAHQPGNAHDFAFAYSQINLFDAIISAQILHF